MAFNYNHATLIGRLTRDPETKKISDTVNKTFFTIAVNRGYRKPDENQDTDFIPVSLWGKSAELAYLLLKKGTPILVTGRIQNRVYEKNEVVRSVSELVGEQFQILEKKAKIDLGVIDEFAETTV